MCNEVARRIALDQIRVDFSQLKIPLLFPEGLPNLAPLDRIRITDPAAIVRAAADGRGSAELVVRRWSWPGPAGKPVYNYRSEGRELRSGRCLIPVDAFYEFTAPEASQKRKTKWAFTHARDAWFAIGGLWRGDVLPAGQGSPREAFTMLTTEPGPDVAPYHSRQMVVIERSDWAGWLDGSLTSASVCRPLPEQSLVANAQVQTWRLTRTSQCDAITSQRETSLCVLNLNPRPTYNRSPR